MSKNRQGRRRIRVGRVMKNRMDKTVVVAVKRLFKHPLYGKTVQKTSRLKAHDEKNLCQVGDLVAVMETRPLSKEKRWRVVEILQKEKAAKGVGDDTGVHQA